MYRYSVYVCEGGWMGVWVGGLGGRVCVCWEVCVWGCVGGDYRVRGPRIGA